MIYDCFSFFNELDTLEIRLNTLDDVVDKFVLVEAVWTHTGKPKPLYFAENRDRFKPFLDKIIHIVVNDNDLPPFPADATDREIAWIRENVQRNAIVKGLSDAKPDDILIISDLDEIPNARVVQEITPAHNAIVNLELRNYAYFLNYRNISRPWWTLGPKVLTVDTFRKQSTYSHAVFNEFAPECANQLPSATLIRLTTNYTTCRDAGWHFSYQGGLSMIKSKFAAYSHTENQTEASRNDEHILSCLELGIDVIDKRIRFVPEPLANGFPDYLAANADRFLRLVKKTNQAEYDATHLRRIIAPIRRSAYDKAIAILIFLTPVKLHKFAAAIRKKLEL